MRPLHQPICLGGDKAWFTTSSAEEFTHLVNNAAHEVHIPIVQEPVWGFKDGDITLIQELVTVLVV